MEDDLDENVGAGAVVGTGGLNIADEDLSLPKATMAKLIQDELPSDISATKEFRDLITDCCVEFIHMISSEATTVCDKEGKKTITGDHVIGALKSLGFDDYVDNMKDVLEEHQKTIKVEKAKKSKSKKDMGQFTEEELLKMQEELFAKSRANMAGSSTAAQPPAAP